MIDEEVLQLRDQCESACRKAKATAEDVQRLIKEAQSSDGETLDQATQNEQEDQEEALEQESPVELHHPRCWEQDVLTHTYHLWQVRHWNVKALKILV